jgi:hypothetical protein
MQEINWEQQAKRDFDPIAIWNHAMRFSFIDREKAQALKDKEFEIKVNYVLQKLRKAEGDNYAATSN